MMSRALTRLLEPLHKAMRMITNPAPDLCEERAVMEEVADPFKGGGFIGVIEACQHKLRNMHLAGAELLQ